jgi:hypothetical protein
LFTSRKADSVMTGLQVLHENYVTLQFSLRNSGQNLSQFSRTLDLNHPRILICVLFFVIYLFVFLKQEVAIYSAICLDVNE